MAKKSKIEKKVFFTGFVEYKEIKMKFNGTFEVGKVYYLNILDSIIDCSENMVLRNTAIQFGLADSITESDLVINEILFNPFSGSDDFVEVYNKSGLKFSDMQRSWKEKKSFNSVYIGLKKERKSLYRDVEERVDDMFEKGLIKEVNKLLKGGYGDSLSLKQAVGYKEVIDYLKGNIDLEECRGLIKKNTRRLAKKQLTWFRNDKRINWLSIDKYDNIIDLAIETIKIINIELNYEKI